MLEIIVDLMVVKYMVVVVHGAEVAVRQVKQAEVLVQISPLFVAQWFHTPPPAGFTRIIAQNLQNVQTKNGGKSARSQFVHD